MDLILIQKMGDNISPFGLGFNPYFNGSNTSTWLEVTWIFCSLDVSILILMDLILLQYFADSIKQTSTSFQSLF